MSISYFLFIFLPITEILLFGLAVSAAGWEAALLLTLLFSGLGLVLLRRPLETNKFLSGDPIDYLLSRLAGPLFFIPGFLTDIIAGFLLFPLGRSLFRRAFRRYLVRWEERAASFQSPWGGIFPFFFGGGASSGTGPFSGDGPFSGNGPFSSYEADYEASASKPAEAAVFPPEPILTDPNPKSNPMPEDEVIDVEFESKSP